VLELRSVRGTGGGPEKTIMLGAVRGDGVRLAVTVCYVRDARDQQFGLDRLARKMGVDYVEVPERHSFDPAVWPALRALVRERQIDVVHAHDYKTDLLAWLLARRETVMPLSTVHGWSGFSRRETCVYYPLDRWILRRFPRVIAVSSAIAATLVRSGVDAGRVTRVANGIDPDAFRRRRHEEAHARADLGLPPAAPVVGAVGRLEIEKRYDVLIEALAVLRRTTTPDAVLLFVGTGSLEADLKRQARQCGIEHACMFLGHRSDVPHVFHAVDVFAQSSDTEGTPNAVLEAMALETPVVATDVGGTRDLIRDGVDGVLVPRRDPQALAKAIGGVLSDPDATRARTSAARQRIEQELSFDARMKTVERIYEELVALRAEARPRRLVHGHRCA
jgi:glycosyltransferase involved in cell wall biosynthesis